MSRAYAPLLAPYGLTYAQYLVLLVLWEGDGLSVSSLGKRLSLDSATLTPVLKRLERAGLLTRRRSAVDEREVRLALTRAGRKLETPMRAVPAAIGARAALPPAALRALRGTLHGLHRKLIAEVVRP